MLDRRTGWDPSACRDPVVVCLEGRAELVVEDPEITLSIGRNRLRHDCLHFLGDHSDIGFIAAVVTEPVEADAVVKVAKQDEVML
jgi:hypothetical protein